MPTLVHSRRRHRAELAESTDREILEAVAAGDELAFDELVTRKSNQLMGLTCRMVGDREEARDLVQLTFVRAWEHRDRYDPKWSPNTWLYRIATNLSIDYLRSRATRERQREPVRLHLLEVTSGGGGGHLASLQDREVARILVELSQLLSERQRAVFVLRELEGLSSEEAGRILGCRASTVRNHLFAARKLLRAELRRRYPEYARGRGREERR